MVMEKGQLNNSTILAGATAFAIGLLVLIITIYASTSVIDSVRDSNIVSQATTITNETVTMTQQDDSGYNGTVTVAQPNLGVSNSSVIFNSPTATLTHGVNYIDNDFGVGTFTILTNYSEADLNITYEFTSDVKNTPTNITQNGLDAFFNFSGQAGNLGTIAAIVLVITILVGGLAVTLGKGSFR